MSGKYLFALEPRHAYTGAKIPWRTDEYREAHGETTTGKRFGWKLFHYLSGGGMRAFGRGIGQELCLRRRRRFYAFAACFFAAWLVLLVV